MRLPETRYTIARGPALSNTRPTSHGRIMPPKLSPKGMMLLARAVRRGGEGDLLGIEVERKAGVRLGGGRSGHLRGDRHIDRENDSARRVVVVDLGPHHDALRPLRDDAQSRALHAVHELAVGSRAANHVHPGDAELENAVVGCIGLDQAGYPGPSAPPWDRT